MLDIIDRLLEGDEDVPAAFVKAKAFWDEFHAAHREDSVETLAQALSDAQMKFEIMLDMNRGLAKGIMALTAIGSLYDAADGISENGKYAAKVIRGFHGSYVSLEVKSGARRAAKMYNLDDFDPGLRELLKGVW